MKKGNRRSSRNNCFSSLGPQERVFQSQQLTPPSLPQLQEPSKWERALCLSCASPAPRRVAHFSCCGWDVFVLRNEDYAWQALWLQQKALGEGNEQFMFKSHTAGAGAGAQCLWEPLLRPCLVTGHLWPTDSPEQRWALEQITLDKAHYSQWA